MKALVTGGGGFLGGAVLRQLNERGDEVRSLARGDYPELEKLGVETRRGDLADADVVDRAVEGCDVVFHVAAKAGIWGPYEDYRRANLLGTENVLAACRRHGVRKLVYTSTPSVVFDPNHAGGLDESAPYAARFFTHYQATKAAAERLVLDANGADLSTVALRPHMIWGPGDPHLVPRLMARARAGQLRLIGGGEQLVDSVYVDNAATAHLLAADRLEPGSTVAGKAYFVTQGEPVPMRDLIGRILATGGLPPITRSVPFSVAYAAGWLFETIYGLLGARDEPRMTRFLAYQLASPHWFDITAARRDLGYDPAISTEEGLKRLAEHYAGNAAKEVVGQ